MNRMRRIARGERLITFRNRSLLNHRYPEVLWLADAKVRKTEEGQAVQGSDSERLFGKSERARDFFQT